MLVQISSIRKFYLDKLIYYQVMLRRKTEVQIIKGSEFKVDILHYKSGNEPDSLMNFIFQDKNIKLVNSKSKYVLLLN